MTNFFVRQSAAFRNDLNRSFGALIGIAQGLVCDGRLNDQEISFLDRWLRENENISLAWPGDVIHQRVKAAIEDGLVTEVERCHLMQTLQQLVGGTLDELAESTHVSELLFDEVQDLVFKDMHFLLTGTFVYASKPVCAEAIERRGGIVLETVTKKLHYVIVGGLGSAEWKHGSFGRKLEDAMRLKRAGTPIRIVHEDKWASSLSSQPC